LNKLKTRVNIKKKKLNKIRIETKK